MTALKALCTTKGLLASENEIAVESGLDGKRWRTIGEQLEAGETLHPKSKEVDAAVTWACVGEIQGKGYAKIRSLLRRRRREILGPTLQASWPKKGKEGARAWQTVEDWMNRPHALGADERRLMRGIWRTRAKLCYFERDMQMFHAMMKNETQAQTLVEAGGEDIDPESLAEQMAENQMDRESAMATLYASEESLRNATEDPERIVSLWLKAKALEHAGLAQRAMQAYKKVEEEQREKTRTTQEDEPGLGEARKRCIWLMWTSGEPESMTQAIDLGIEEGTKGTWAKQKAKEWGGGNAKNEIEQVREATKALHEAEAIGNDEQCDQSREKLGQAYAECGLYARALSTTWEKGASREGEARIAKVAARSAVMAGKNENTVKMLWERALAADAHDANAMIGLASHDARIGNKRSAALWTTKALWTNRRTRTLEIREVSEAAEILIEDQRYEASARADRRIKKENGRKLNVDIAIGIAQRAIEREDEDWETSLDVALDAIAINRAGLATLCVLSSKTLRARAKRRSNGTSTSKRAEAEAIRKCVRETIDRRTGREKPTPDAYRRFVRMQLDQENRMRIRVLARLPEPLALGVRGQETSRLMNDPDGSLRAGSDERTASLWEEWALRLAPNGHPTDARAQREVERMRRSNPGRREETWEWETRQKR